MKKTTLFFIICLQNEKKWIITHIFSFQFCDQMNNGKKMDNECFLFHPIDLYHNFRFLDRKSLCKPSY